MTTESSAWAAKYKDMGLVVIGVHSAWPAVYMVDSKGKVRWRHLGEGEYEESERLIQRLLTETGAQGVPRDLVSPTGHGAEVAADWATLRSRRASGTSPSSASPRQAARSSTSDTYTPLLRASGSMSGRSPAVGLESGAASSKEASGRISNRFHARDVNLVLGPATRGASVRFRVLVDGRAPSDAHGSDVVEQGLGIVTDQRLYQLVRKQGRIADRTFEIEFLDPGVQAFVFTFG